MKNSFLIYHEYRDILEDLTNEELGKLFRAIFDYEIDNKIPHFVGLMKMAFMVIKGNLDRDRNKYDKRCESSSENGKKGGAPKGNQNAKKQPKNNLKQPNQPKQADNDNETDTENGNDNDNASASDKGKSADLLAEDGIEKSADLFSSDETSETNADLFTYIQEALGRTLNSIEYEVINEWQDNDLTRYAVKESILNGARGIRYIQTVLESWKAKGFKTVQDVQAYQIKRKQNIEKQNLKEKELPDWFNKDLKNEEMTEEDKKELDDLLESITETIEKGKKRDGRC